MTPNITQRSIIECQTITTVALVVKVQASKNLHELDEKSFHKLRMLGGIERQVRGKLLFKLSNEERV
ncbi:MAG: hypothetical protein E7013_04340 [Alphaproteobacteria bacterium]|nr:hypothetical protein [Alphaproteobacteria bacterium]